jgi:Cu/Ag efflux protein CusF
MTSPTLLLLLVLVGASSPIASALAQMSPEHSSHHGASVTPAAGFATGEVRKIDRESGKITIKHGPLQALDMPPMTMVFQASDRSMLDRVKVGDTVQFVPENRNGVLTVTHIEAR